MWKFWLKLKSMITNGSNLETNETKTETKLQRNGIYCATRVQCA